MLIYLYMSIYSKLILFTNTNMYYISFDSMYTEQKTGNDMMSVSLYTQIMPFYHSIPKHKSLIPRYLIHFFHFYSL